MSCIRFLLAFGSVAGLSLFQTQAYGQSKTQSKPAASSKPLDPFTNVSLFEGIKSGVIDAKAV
ncbi:MAG: hypothetical protein WCJ40_21670, partial [Planctomycetota bacterium]